MIRGLKAALLIAGLGMVLGTQNARAGRISVELLGNGTYSMATGTPTPVASFAYPGGGLNLNFNLGPKAAFQIGGHYMTRLVTTDVSYTSTYASYNAGFKFMFSRGFSLILGGYYNSYMTNGMGLSTNDMGVSAGLGLALPLGQALDLYISPMYHYALTAPTYAGGTYTPSEVIAFVGFVFGGGSK
jgi:hypothetical protein